MIVYCYDEETKEYKFEDEADKSPLEPGIWLMPANSTEIEPPTITEEEKVACFIDGEWSILTDHRKHYQVNLDTIVFSIVDYVGEAQEGYQFISDEVYADYQSDHDKYKVIDGVFTDVSDTEEYKQLKLQEAKTKKYNEAKTKAYAFLESGEALYEFEEGKHIEATDGNIAKFTAYALNFASGSTDPVAWCTKEDETVFLNQEQVIDILQGLGMVQAQVWTVKFTDYVADIESATTVEEVNAIIIDYHELIQE